jgi:hypothetical protein
LITLISFSGALPVLPLGGQSVLRWGGAGVDIFEGGQTEIVLTELQLRLFKFLLLSENTFKF